MELGTVIAERYEVVRVIGQGSHGAVCEVLDRTTDERAALKILIGDDADLMARLEREAKALAVLAHPHVVALVDSGHHDGKPYLVTELIAGNALRSILDSGAIAPRRALEITRQLLEALDHVHAAGIVHRDIKPENIMLAAGGQSDRDYVKLIDFGVAKMIDPANEVLGPEKLTRAGLEVIGSAYYIAPENAVGEPVDARSDVYSLAVVLFEMLAGDVPFDDPDTRAILRKHVTDPVPPLRLAAPDGTSIEVLEPIVRTALAKVPDQRYASAMAMHAAIVRAIEAGAKKIDTPPPQRVFADRARELVASVRRHPRLSTAIAAVVVALVTAVIVMGRSSEESPPPAPVPVVDPAPARSFVEQAESEIARRRYGRAIAAFERALVADSSLARSPTLRTGVVQIVEGGDAVAAVVALEVLATRLQPPDHETIVRQASMGKLPEVRRRAFAIAERDDFAQSIDRFASWTLDLKQQATCEERRETITRLRDLGDPRAIEPLQKARVQYACVAKDAAAAIAHLEPPK